MTITHPFTRTRLTWQTYLLMGFYSYLLNALGPLTPFLRDELALSYTLASLHFSAYAVGLIAGALALHPAARRLGARGLMWSGAAGMAAGALLLMAGRTALVTIFGAFLMGLMGVCLIALASSALADQHSAHRGIAFTESALISSLISTLAPVAIGFFARTPLTWRAGLGLMVLVLPLLWLIYGRDPLPAMDTAGGASEQAARELSARELADQPKTGLPRLYWVYWFGLLLAVAIESCIIFWAADYLEHASGLARANAALGVSAFLGAELVGRAVTSRLLRRMAETRVLWLSLLAASLGFGLFWLVPAPLPALVGLVLAGSGVAGLFPIINAQALAAVPGRMVEASGRISLAVGVAILLLPLLLGRLADWAGIRAGYSVVAALLALAGVTLLISEKEKGATEAPFA